MDRPTVVLALVPALTEHLFAEDLRARLASVAEVLDDEPITDFASPRARALLPRAEILLTGWGAPRIDAAVLDRAPRLRAVVHAAGTVKLHVDAACWARGIVVTSAAAANAIPVAEYTLAMILLANKRVLRLREHYRELRRARAWARDFPDLGNYRRTVGIVGASQVGRRVLELLRPFDLEVLVNDPFLDEAGAAALGARLADLDELVATSDVVSLHAPALLETHHLIDARRLALLRDGATLINTARGWLVDHAALERELASGRIDAVIDTTDPEVLPAGSPLYELPNVFLTPHVAGAMGTETQRLAALAIDEIERLARGEAPLHAIRAEDLAHLA
ncbi:hydroxyacid dehydrogenase [Candidatus Binatia bacterium]|nr:hydroxyacid dehydrogenase [Candidatus Binatia bacterium]